MKINITNHCIDQVIIRKNKRTKKSATFFSLYVFKEMITTMKYKGSKCIIRKGNGDRLIIYNKYTGYKFVYDYDEKNNYYTVVTFAIHTKLDNSIGDIMRILGIKK